MSHPIVTAGAERLAALANRRAVIEQCAIEREAWLDLCYDTGRVSVSALARESRTVACAIEAYQESVA